MRASVVFTVLAALTLTLSPGVRADADSAKVCIKEAEDLIANNNTYDYEKAKTKLELAEAELDGVAEAAKKPVLAAIQVSKDKIAAGILAFDKPTYMRKLTRAMDDAEGSIGNLATWGTAEREFNEVFADAKAQVAIKAELAAAAKKFATFKKLNAKKSALAHAEEITSSLAQIEEKWADDKKEMLDPDTSANSKEGIVEQTSRSIKETRKRITEQLPADDDNTKAMVARLDKIAQESVQLGLAGRVKEVVETLKRQIDLYKDDWGGYENEKAGPTWADYSSKQSEKMSRFLAPKTAEFLMRTDDFLANLEKDEDYKSVQADPKIKAIIEDVTAKRNAAAVKPR